MQFKHPEILWFLLLLLIPLIIHLFQLRRFKKTPFTNVAMLQKVISESRKSNTLKKWLLLFTRMLLLACLVLAFAQPFFAKSNALQPKETVVYLDDSFSMQAKNDGVSLLEQAVQDLVKSVPESAKFSLFTNTETFRNVDIKQLQNDLISLNTQANQLSLENVVRKANTLFSKDGATIKDLVIISDFQLRMGRLPLDTLGTIRMHAVPLRPLESSNVALDSIIIIEEGFSQSLEVFTTGLEEGQSVPLALYNDKRLIAKTSIASNGNRASTAINLPAGEAIKGKLEITDNALDFDNTLFFNVDEKPKIKVLAISANNADFLGRIFTEDEFQFSITRVNSLNYSEIPRQNLVVLHELTSIPQSLQTAIGSFLKDGGNLVMIPSSDSDLITYNRLLKSTLNLQINEKINAEKQLTTIAFDHPLFKGVFEREVDNFDYPKISEYYTLTGNGSKILSFSSGEPFLVGNNNVYFFTGPLNQNATDFQESPLIVPSFYKMGTNSLKLPESHFYLEDRNKVDLPITLVKDEIIKLVKNGEELIPLQQSYPTKVGLTFEENPQSAGIFSVVRGQDTLQHISFNHKRNESDLNYQSLDDGQFASISEKIPDLFYELAQENSIDAYWKWFVIFAILFALVEVLIQKFLA